MKLALKILLITSALSMTAIGLLSPIVAIFVEEIGGNLLDAGSALAIYSIATGSLVFLISRWGLAEKDPAFLIVTGYGIMVIGFIGYLFIKNPIDLFIVEVILGFAEAITIPSYDGLYSASIEEGKFANRWGLWDSMSYIVSAIAAFFGGLIAQLFGFKALFYVMFLISLISFLISLILYKRKGFSKFLVIKPRRR